MNIPRFFLRWFTVAVLWLGLAIVCGCDAATTPPPRTNKETKKPGPAEQLHTEQPQAKRLRLEVHGDKRRVLLEAEVPQHGNGEGYLEFFLSSNRRMEKGYESVLVTKVEAHELNEMLLAAGAVPGTPFDPELEQLPRGQTLKISLRYEKDGKEVIDLAQTWLKKREGGGAVNVDWIYTGSRLVDAEQSNQPPIFLADDSASLISSGNSPTTLIDVNVTSSNRAANSDFCYNSDRIPPPGTKVTVIFEPVGVYKKGQK